MRSRLAALTVAAFLLSGDVGTAVAASPDGDEQDRFSAATFSGLAFRDIGPGITSGRISDLAVRPDRPSTMYATAASGGVWKTTNGGTTWTPIFDDQGSFSIGCIAMDPTNPLVLWVGTGENNSQRSVSYGDGVYKSEDGGTSWENVGLGESEHIGKILIDPRDPDVVYVAAQGPLWRAGGDRGLYKTTDGGATWTKVLDISQHTGVTDVVFDPRDADTLYAASYQRRRRTWTLINGGPESGLHKSTDGGKTWTELESGLPTVQMGRIGLAVADADPVVLYAIVEALDDEGGVYRSLDGGANWEKRADYVSASPQYYQELVVDPNDPDVVYSMDTWMHRSEDGGATWTKVPETSKHVDNHAMWIDPTDSDHLIAGCDGGIYESFDRGETWRFFDNLPLTQFYQGTADNDLPFYNVYGGTQDNSTLGGPARNASQHGITNREWFVVVGGDGFEPQVDPDDPNTVYAQWQHGGLVRHDKRSGENVDIKPQPGPGDDPPRWNWDSAFLISPHSSERLYFAAQRVYRSDDRGDHWTPISDDLTRGLDRNRLEVMDRVWSVDTVAKNKSTSYFGNIVSLAESPFVEGLIYAGTDDGLVQVTEDGGRTWRKVERFPGVPDMSYVTDIEASRHDPDTTFVALDNHKSGDFRPYLLRSDDRGRTWRSIAGDLPARGNLHAVVQDPVREDLLFVGTEFGAFFTVDGGRRWIQLEGGIPTIAVRDVEIQAREGDLVAATFGRGFHILDDIGPLRELSSTTVEEPAALFTPRRTWMFVESYPLGYPGKAFLGDTFYTAPNPPVGALFTYYLRDPLESRRDRRRKSEEESVEAGRTLTYPTWEELRAEDHELDPAVVLTIRDAAGEVVRRVTGPTESGFHRVSWDLRYAPADPVDLDPQPPAPFTPIPMGPMVLPGTYSAELARFVDGSFEPLSGPRSFELVPAKLAAHAATDPEAVLEFQAAAVDLQRRVLAAIGASGEIGTRIDHVHQAVIETAGAPIEWLTRVSELRTRRADVEMVLTGDATVARRNEPTPPSVLGRVEQAVYGGLGVTAPPTGTHRTQIEIATADFEPLVEELTRIETDLSVLESELEAVGATWTPGRLPVEPGD